MPIILTLVLVANAFVTGLFFADADKPTSFIDYTKRIALLLILLLFGAALFIGEFIYDATVNHIWKFINSKFQIHFFIRFYMRKGYNNLEVDRLYKFNLLANERYNTNSFSDRVFRCCVRLVNKRNNYTYTKVALD
jgi:hypothetical protein